VTVVSTHDINLCDIRKASLLSTVERTIITLSETEIIMANYSDIENLVRLCAVAEVPVGEGYRVDLGDGRAIAVYNLNNAFYATDDLCSHGDASLSEGILEDDFQILCPFHMGGFDIRTGEVTASPCQIPIRAYAVVEVNGTLYVRSDELG